jgi:hypothetical protein
MTEPLNTLIEALREELRQYGEMLARLDAQQECITKRAADEVLSSAASVQEQSSALRAAQCAREEHQRRVAESFGAPAQSTLAQLTHRLPAECRPLIRALVEENNQLLTRVQQRARQNHVLLRRSLDLMHELLQTFCPTAKGTLYDVAGRSRRKNHPAVPICDVAG